MHDTDVRTLVTSVDGFGLVTIDQVVPFQDSARVWLADPLK